MDRLTVTLATRDYSFVTPLATGDVQPEGLTLRLIRAFDALPRVLRDPAIDGGEASFSRYVQRLAAGDRDFVGLPVFVMREFRHRNFYVRRDSGLRRLEDLRGRRIAVDGWPNSGNTWSRALLQAAGVGLDDVQWVVGPVHPGDPPPPPDPLPAGVTRPPAGECLTGMLRAGTLDVLVWAWAPRGLYEPDGPFVRLFPDYPAVEQAYYRQTGIYPGHHIVVLRRAVADRHPQVVRQVYDAFVRAREAHDRDRWQLHEGSPWMLADLEAQAALFGPAFRPYGSRENRAMIEAFCAAQAAQRLIPAPLDPAAVFADFERLAA